MKFSIIIPVKDDPRVRDVVAALLPQVGEGEIVVANDGARGTLAPLPGVQIVEVNAANPGGARNAAAARARGEILLFTDADVVIPPDWVGAALAGFSEAGVQAIQGMSRAVGGDTVARLMQEEYERFLRSHTSTGQRDLCDSRCFGIRKSIFERFPFDPADVYCEDAALGRRLFEAGVSIRFLPAWEVGHLYTRSVGRELARLRRYARGGSLYERRTGQDLFRSPGEPAARGPGPALLRLAAAHPRLGPPAARLVAGAAIVLGAGARAPGSIGRTMFTAARRAMVLSARLDPGPAPAAAAPVQPESESPVRDTIRPSGKRKQEHPVPELVESNPAAVTIVVVPRERFSVAVRSLETLLRNTTPPYRLIYVDGGSPPPIARRLAAEAAAKRFELIRTEQFLVPNEARNLAFERITSPYVVFVDNDLLVEPGWLERLVRCAEETGADLVGPLYGAGEPGDGRVHMAGGLARIEERGGERHLTEEHRFAGRRAAEIEGDLKREPTELLEFHCLLVRSATLRALGGLDEGYLSTGEHIDLCLLVRERGGGIYLEPASRVTYLIPSSLDAFDRSYFRLRWSESWTRASLERLREKWGLARRDPYLAEHFHWLRSHRRLAVRPAEHTLQSLLGKSLARPARMALAAAEIAWNRLQFPARRATGGDRSRQTRP